MNAMELSVNREQDSPLRTYGHLMLEHLPVGIALFDARDLRLLAANARYHVLHEPVWQHGHALGQTLAELVPEAECPAITAIFQKVAQTGMAYYGEEDACTALARGGTSWSWTLDPICEHGRVCYLLLTLTEITSQSVARKSAKQEHAALEETHHALEREQRRLEYTETILLSVQNASEPKELAQAVLSAVDQCFSPALLALYSTHPEQGALSLLASHTTMDLAEPLFPPRLSSPSGLAPLLAMQQRTPIIKRKSQETSQDKGCAGDALLSLPQIQCVVSLPLWKKRCEGVLVTAFASSQEADDLLVRTLSGCAPHLAGALASARLHAVIADEQQRLHTVLDQLPEGVLLVEAAAGLVSYANAAAADLLGVALPQLVGSSLKQAMSLPPYQLSRQNQKSAVRWDFPLVHALWGKTITNQELLVTRPDGSEIFVLSSAAPIRTTDGLLSGAVMVFQDITALKQLDQQKNEFFAVANHELRTPLTSILGFVELLEQHPPEGADDRYRYAITSIMQECDHLRRLIGELLDVSRLEYARLDLERSYHDLLTPLRQLVTKQARITSTHQVYFTLEDLEPTDLLMGWFDLLRIEQVVTNLLTNAIKYSPAGGEIEVGVRPCRDAQGEAQQVVIWVKDQGIGIAARDLPQIFKRFYRAHTFGKTSISGFGIGLYLTKELVQGHGGRIWVESTKGQGSTFFVALPLGETA